jgi:hypothetical protein
MKRRRKLYLNNLYSPPNIFRTIKYLRMSCAGHVGHVEGPENLKTPWLYPQANYTDRATAASR